LESVNGGDGRELIILDFWILL
jgi:hypothetical protein